MTARELQDVAGQRNEEVYRIVDATVGEAAGAIDQRAVPGIAETATHRPQILELLVEDVVADAREGDDAGRHGIHVVAEVRVLNVRLDAEHEGAGLPVVADLPAADETFGAQPDVRRARAAATVALLMATWPTVVALLSLPKP